MTKAKSYAISKQVVWEAYKRVKANRGAAGVDGESLAAFEQDLKNNLYKIWNRMSSGSYFPPPVRLVEIPKGNTGKTRPLGIPTVSDRIAQTVVKMYFEPQVEPYFHPDSYGYRPGKSALEAVGVTRQRCWRQDWVIDLDIKGFFDNLDHALVLRAVRHHTQVPWILLYVERWLKAPVQREDGTLEERTKGSPQGSVVSPLLANLFLHYAFDEWMRRHYPHIQFARYADDTVIHAKSLSQAEHVLEAVRKRLQYVRFSRLHVSSSPSQEPLGKAIRQLFAGGEPESGELHPRHHSFVASRSDPQQPEPGRDRRLRQSLCTWLGELLWPILSFGLDPSTAVPGTFVGLLGTAEIQTASLPSTASCSVVGPDCPPRASPVRFMAAWNLPCGWTIRAG